MVQFRPTAREIVAKIVYYGPPLGGKTTNLKALYNGYPEELRGELIVLPTGTDRTIYFDYLPLTVRTLRGMNLRIQLYTVPGQVRFDSTRQVVLRGVDGVVFVADSQLQAMQANRDSWANLKKNLALQGLFLDRLPHVLQYNKRDLPEIATVEELDRTLNEFNAPFFEAVAIEGIGVEDTLQAIVKLVVRSLRDRFNLGVEGQPALQAVPPTATEDVVTRPLTVKPQPLPREEFLRSHPLPPPEVTPPTVPLAAVEPPEGVVIPMPTPAHPPATPGPEPMPPSEPAVEASAFSPEMELPLEPEPASPAMVEEVPFGPAETAAMGAPLGAEVRPAPEPFPPAPWEEPEAQPISLPALELELPPAPVGQEGAERAVPPTPAGEAEAFGGEPFEADLEPPRLELPELGPEVPGAEPESGFAQSGSEAVPLGVVGAVREGADVPLAQEPAIVAAAPEPLADPFAVEELPNGGSGEDVFALVPCPPAEVVSPAAAIERVIPRAVARHGELRELEVEVPVPAAWVGGRRVTLQLRLTLVPEEENHEP